MGREEKWHSGGLLRTRRGDDSRQNLCRSAVRSPPTLVHTTTLSTSPPMFIHISRITPSGAFAVVEQCLFKPQDRLVAVKRLRPDFVKSKEEVESLKSEIALLRKLYDPHIIEYIGWGSWDDSSEEAAEKSLFLVQVWGEVHRTRRANIFSVHVCG